MEQRRVNWPAWLALGISLVALVVALGSMAMSRQAMWTMWAMPGWSNQPMVPNLPPSRLEREKGDRGQFVPPGWRERGKRDQFILPPSVSGHAMPGMMGGKGWFGGLFNLIDGLLKLAALALLIWLGIRIFRQRQTPPAPPAPPAPPLTPAGHDPRVE